MNNINKTSIIREQRDLSEKMILDGNLNISKINDEESFDETEKKDNGGIYRYHGACIAFPRGNISIRRVGNRAFYRRF